MANLQGNICHTLRTWDEKWWTYSTCIDGMLFLPATRFDIWSGDTEHPNSNWVKSNLWWKVILKCPELVLFSMTQMISSILGSNTTGSIILNHCLGATKLIHNNPCPTRTWQIDLEKFHSITHNSNNFQTWCNPPMPFPFGERNFPQHKFWFGTYLDSLYINKLHKGQVIQKHLFLIALSTLLSHLFYLSFFCFWCVSFFLEKKLSLITSRNCFPTDSFHQSHSKQLVTSPFSNREKSTDSRRWVVVLATFFLEKIEKHHWLYIRFRGASRCDCCSSCWWTNQGVDFSPFWS